MSKVRLVAQLLAKRFMAEGKMAVVPQRVALKDDPVQLASAQDKQEIWEETSAFAGLAVQAVGHEDGKQKAGVVVYATKGTAREFKTFPKEIDGVPIAVRKIGLVSIHQGVSDADTTAPNIYVRKGRVACGSSCATATGSPGTFGALVARKHEEAPYMLSNNHVLAACNQITPGMPIIAPAPDDAQPDGFLPVSFARLTEAIPIRSGDPGLVHPCEEDVALGRILQPSLVSSWQGGADHGYDTPTAIADPVVGMSVKKFGRTTGLTVGKVDALVSDPFPIPCQAKNFKGIVWFKNVFYVLGSSAFALPGDSGSLVVTENGKAAVGILFSSNASGHFGQVIPIRHILKELDVALLGGHGI